MKMIPLLIGFSMMMRIKSRKATWSWKFLKSCLIWFDLWLLKIKISFLVKNSKNNYLISYFQYILQANKYTITNHFKIYFKTRFTEFQRRKKFSHYQILTQRQKEASTNTKVKFDQDVKVKMKTNLAFAWREGMWANLAFMGAHFPQIISYESFKIDNQ